MPLPGLLCSASSRLISQSGTAATGCPVTNNIDLVVFFHYVFERARYEANLYHELAKSLAANRLALQDFLNRVVAYACFAFELADSGLENLLFDLVARNYLFRALVL